MRICRMAPRKGAADSDEIHILLHIVRHYAHRGHGRDYLYHFVIAAIDFISSVPRIILYRTLRCSTL